MSGIRVEGLTKRFGSVTAIEDVSFDVAEGDIVGLLGPNGAGKTTTMRILACFAGPTAGRAEVAGYDVIRAPLAVRRRIGYMPESVPMYPEMRVREYLLFRARLKGVARQERKWRMSASLDMCDLRGADLRIIGQLARGHRQRLALADCLLSDPPVLVLDEPTVGLDPNQIRKTRELIRSMSDRKTVLLSTHILSEVEAICRRFVVIDEGRVAAVREMDSLRARTFLQLELRAPVIAARQALLQIAGVGGVSGRQEGAITRLRVECSESRDVEEAVYRASVANNWVLREMRRERMTLEDLFVEITAREPRTGGEASL